MFIISPLMADVVKAGPKVAVAVHVPDGAKTVRLVKRYDRPVASSPPTREDQHREQTTELALLRERLAEAKDRERRLREEIKSEIEMLNAALEEEKDETIDQVRRRISRLRGSLEYPGHASTKARNN